MVVWFPIQIAWEISLKTPKNPGKVGSMDFHMEFYTFRDGPEILHSPSPCMDINQSNARDALLGERIFASMISITWEQ